MSTFKVAVVGLLGLLCVVVITQNTAVVTLRFLVWNVAMSQVVLLALTLAVGIVIGFVVGKTGARRR